MYKMNCAPSFGRDIKANSQSVRESIIEKQEEESEHKNHKCLLCNIEWYYTRGWSFHFKKCASIKRFNIENCGQSRFTYCRLNTIQSWKGMTEMKRCEGEIRERVQCIKVNMWNVNIRRMIFTICMHEWSQLSTYRIYQSVVRGIYYFVYFADIIEMIAL